MTRYFVGMDLGQAADYTAISAIEVHPTPYPVQYEDRDPETRRLRTFETVVESIPLTHHVRHLERLPIGTPYPTQVARVKEIMARLPPGTDLIVDNTGGGAGGDRHALSGRADARLCHHHRRGHREPRRPILPGPEA